MNALSFPLATRIPVPTSHWDGELAVDLFAPRGTAVLAVFDGIANARDYPSGGHTVIVTADDGTQAYYAHLQAPGVSGRVQARSIIGYVGSTGNAEGTEPHLHFAVGSINNEGGGTIAPHSWLANTESPPGNGGGQPPTDPIRVAGGLGLVALILAILILTD